VNRFSLRIVALNMSAFMLAFGQSGIDVNHELARLTSPDLHARSEAFYRLLGPMMKNTGSVPIGVANASRAHSSTR
jgi:hypothetical protein